MAGPAIRRSGARRANEVINNKAYRQDVSDLPFFAGGVNGNQNDFLYYSLATLTTTGYGDFTAAGELGRTFSVLEALFGQIYLVTVVALLVSNLRRLPPEERRIQG